MWPALELGRCVALESGVTLLAFARTPAPTAPLLVGRERAVFDDLAAYPLRSDEWLAGRAAAKGALRALGFAPDRIEVLPLESGAPVVHVDGRPDETVFLNLTHTRLYALAAAARFPVGVDVCDEVDGPRLERIARRVFSEGEAEACGAHRSASHQAAVWALKEAVLKLRIGGVFDPGASSVRVVALDPPEIADPQTRVELFRLPEAMAAIAVGYGARP